MLSFSVLERAAALTAGNQLELYLDAEGTVLKTTNDDQDLNLEGLGYAAAVDAVLSARNVNRTDVHIEVMAIED